MIFATDATGASIFRSPDWTRVTGQAEADAQGEGWATQVHEEDRTVVAASLRRALSLQSPFATRHRLRFADGSYRWVLSGAVPSFCPRRGKFLGFMGSVTECEAPETGVASGWLGTYEPSMPHAAAPEAVKLDRAVDHMLVPRSLLAMDDPRSDAIMQAIDLALYIYGQQQVRQ